MSIENYGPRVISGDVYSESISANLTAIAVAVGIERHLWSPASVGITRADEMVPALTEAIAKLKADPDQFFKYDAPQRWGIYEQFLAYLERYLAQCKRYPTMDIR